MKKLYEKFIKELVDNNIKNPIITLIIVIIGICVGVGVLFIVFNKDGIRASLINQSQNVEFKDNNLQNPVIVFSDNTIITESSLTSDVEDIKENTNKNSMMQMNFNTYEVEQAGWGDNSNTGYGRDVFEMYQVENGILEDKVVFNSITNGQYYDDNKKIHKLPDERNFVGVREYYSQNMWNMDEIIVEDGKEYCISMFVHNDNYKEYDAIGYDTRVSYSIPGNTSNKIIVNGFIFCENAIPSKYWDSVVFVSENNQLFHLEYYSNSALWESNGRAAGKISDDIIKQNGVLVGYENLDGRIPGGYMYSGYASVKVRVVFDK